MRSILVANPKGGSGKTTVSTNLAALFAHRRYRTVLADMDKQQSAARWLMRRPLELPRIMAWSADTDKKEIKSFDPHWVIIDSPAGVHGEKLAELVRRSELVLVPVAPSAFDMEATLAFLTELRKEKPVRKGDSQVAVIGNRVDARTVAASELEAFLKSLEVPILSHLRDAQIYVHCARDGQSVFDVAPSRADIDLEQWRPIQRWLAKHLQIERSAKRA